MTIYYLPSLHRHCTKFVRHIKRIGAFESIEVRPLYTCRLLHKWKMSPAQTPRQLARFKCPFSPDWARFEPSVWARFEPGSNTVLSRVLGWRGIAHPSNIIILYSPASVTSVYEIPDRNIRIYKYKGASHSWKKRFLRFLF